jgi:hypothetical protein
MSAANWSLIVALCWIAPFAIGGYVRLGDRRFSRRLLSAAGGSAIAYVFIDLLRDAAHAGALPGRSRRSRRCR